MILWFWSPAGIYLLKVNNRNITTRCEICSKLTIKTTEPSHWRRLWIMFTITTLDIVMMALLLTLNIFHTLFQCFYCWLWTCNCRLGIDVWNRCRQCFLNYDETIIRYITYLLLRIVKSEKSGLFFLFIIFGFWFKNSIVTRLWRTALYIDNCQPQILG